MDIDFHEYSTLREQQCLHDIPGKEEREASSSTSKGPSSAVNDERWDITGWGAEGIARALQSISQSSMAPGTVQTASVGDSQPGVTNLSTGAAKYDASIQKLTIPGISFNLSCPTGLRVSWTSGQPTGQPQQPVNGQQGAWPVISSTAWPQCGTVQHRAVRFWAASAILLFWEPALTGLHSAGPRGEVALFAAQQHLLCSSVFQVAQTCTLMVG